MCEARILERPCRPFRVSSSADGPHACADASGEGGGVRCWRRPSLQLWTGATRFSPTDEPLDRSGTSGRRRASAAEVRIQCGPFRSPVRRKDSLGRPKITVSSDRTG